MTSRFLISDEYGVVFRTMNCRIGFVTYMTTDIPTKKAIQTMASLHPSRAAPSFTTFLPLSSSPAPVNTQRLTSPRWMCTVSLQILPHSCANPHRRRRALWESQTSWNAWLPSTSRRSPSLRCTIWRVFSLTRYVLCHTHEEMFGWKNITHKWSRHFLPHRENLLILSAQG